MKLLSFTKKYDKPICIALGFFDCVHKGHAALIKKVKERAAELSCEPVVFTFSDNPYSFFDKSEKLIFSFDERKKLLSDCGIKNIISIPFENIRNLGKDEFIKLLVDSFDIRALVCGHDYKFGKNASGNSNYLSDFCLNNGIMCDIIQPVTHNGDRISSTAVKQYLSCGDIPSAVELMGHGYFICGTVCHGRGVGRIFKFPTANVKIESDKLIPACGVYATETRVGDKLIKSVTNVGSKPTFGVDGITVETMLLDFDKDIYGEKITINFIRKLRDVRKFGSPEELRMQIYEDSRWR